MARPRAHLKRAPIAEAVIDFRVLRREGVSPDQFRALTAIGHEYGSPSPMHSIEARFGIEGGRPVAPTQVQAAVGWVYKADGAVAQFRLDGFTFSKLEPYTTWESVFGEADRLWRIYAQTAQPFEISRLAVRYINRLRLPGPAELRQYLEAPPVLPLPMPQAIREFLTRVVVENGNHASAILIQALEPSLDPATVPLLLDIDAFREVSLPPGDPSLPGIFEQLRRLKNDIFFASVTEKTVAMFE
ncbi:MAG: TIGR04255 family protein [Acidobacteria bacterium]|nr:TIGR04255 family protein [Acidobacteriota bacterium]